MNEYEEVPGFGVKRRQAENSTAGELADLGNTAGSAVSHLLYLQQTIGNHGVQRLLKAEPRVVSRVKPDVPSSTKCEIQSHGLGEFPQTIQRFDEGEHKAIGDAATGITLELAPGFPITYGDAVSLAGDYFGDWPTLRILAGKEGITEGTRGEVWYALLVKIRANSEGRDKTAESRGAVEAEGLGKFYDLKAKAAVEQRFNGLAANNVAHFPNPQKGDSGRSIAEKDSGPEAIGGGASYRQNHAQALLVAAATGQSKRGSRPSRKGKEGLNDALFLEAFGDHFLTDAFSAGHQQTERLSIKQYWDAKVLDFWINFQHWLAENVTAQLSEHPSTVKTWIGSQLNRPWVAEYLAFPQVQEAMAGLPELGFGDIVSGAIHDYFNKYGAEVDVAGNRITLVGDKNLLTEATVGAANKNDQMRHVTDQSRNTFKAATAAVQAGIREVYTAYELGRQGEDPTSVADKILKSGEGLFAAEKLMPTLAPDALVSDPQHKSLMWERNSYEELLSDARLADGLTISFASYADLVSSTLAGLSEEQLKAVNVVLVSRMKGGRGKVLSLIREVINFTPKPIQFHDKADW